MYPYFIQVMLNHSITLVLQMLQNQHRSNILTIHPSPQDAENPIYTVLSTDPSTQPFPPLTCS
jgi:hypothetical protein